MKVVLIYNTKSGGRYGLRRLRKLLKEQGVSVNYSFTVAQLSSRKLAALINGGVIVMVVGGDGTLNAAARLIVNTKSTLFPLPGGTFNHFIRDLGMSPRLEDVIAGVGSAKERMVDVAYVNDELFLNNSNLGMYPFSLIERKKTKKIIGKWFAAILSAIDQLSLFRQYRLVIDGKKIHSPFVFVGNNIYDIKKSLIPQRTSLSSATLTVMVATSASRLGLIRDIMAVMRGDVSRQDDFHLSRRKSLTIYSHRHRLLVSFDGEVKHLATPLEYRVAPKSLRILRVESQ